VSRLCALRCVAALVCALFLGVTAGPAAAFSLKEDPFAQQGEKLTSSEVTEFAEQGASVALSANGDTALIGAPFYKTGAGAAWVYVREGGKWAQQAKLVGKNASALAHQGYSVALSADGDTALVGAPENAGPSEEFYGATYVFVRESGIWHEQAKLIAATGATTKGAQGSSVSLSASGDTALVGAEKNEESGGRAPGAAFVFTRSGSMWSQQGGALIGKHPAGEVAEGESVSLAGNGETALIGGPSSSPSLSEPELGAAWVFTLAGGIWSEQTELAPGTGATIHTAQGDAVALSGNGETAIVGGPGYKDAIGAAWVYVRNGEKWEQQGPPLQGNDAGTLEADLEGQSVALSEDGDTALIGGPDDNISLGAAWAFQRSGSTWSEQEKLVGTGAMSSREGAGVALSADGYTALVGGPADNGEEGATWVFARTPESGGEEKQPEEKPKEEQKEPSKEQSLPSTGNVSTAAGAGSSSDNSSSSDGTNNQPPSSPTSAELETKLATAFGLPSAKLCYSKRSFKIHIQQPPGYPRVVSAEVFLGTKRERSLNKKGLTDEVVLKQLPYGTFTIRIVARTVTGTLLTGTRTYHTCRPKPIHPHGHPRL
jgi:hypothetical protein